MCISSRSAQCKSAVRGTLSQVFCSASFLEEHEDKTGGSVLTFEKLSYSEIVSVDFCLFAVIQLTQYEIVQNLNLSTLFVFKSNTRYLVNFLLLYSHNSEENPLQLPHSSVSTAANTLLNSHTS